jgi:hypothetical protein
MEISGDLHNSAAVLPGKELLVSTEQQDVWAAEQF